MISLIIFLLTLEKFYCRGSSENSYISEYMGCYKTFHHNSVIYNVDSIESVTSCITHCNRTGQYTFAALKAGDTCICGYKFENSRHEYNCNIRCSDKNKEFCGGKDYYSVYSVCRVGYYGRICDKPCEKCANSVPCQRYNGDCYSSNCRKSSTPADCDLTRLLNEVNVAFNRNAQQVSDYSTNGREYPAHLAVDGNENSNFSNGYTCSHTMDTHDPWFYVDLEVERSIKSVVITNRNDFGKRLQNARVYLSNSAPPNSTSPNRTCGKVTNATQIKIKIDCPNEAIGRYLVVTIPKREFLTICEIEVFARGCKKHDDCRNKELCHQFGGQEENRCVCQVGYSRQQMTSECSDIDECSQSEHTCNVTTSICKNNEGSYECECKSGFFKSNNGICQDIDECRQNKHECDTRTSICVNSLGSYVCECNLGYQRGYHSRDNSIICIDINECNTRTNQCDRSSTDCVNTPGSFACACKSGFNTPLNKKCQDIDECNGDKNKCDLKTTTCMNTHGSYQCKCKEGFEKQNNVDTTCIDIDECGIEHDLPNRNCINTIGSYHLQCEGGYQFATNKSCIDTNECNDISIYDKTTTECTNHIGGYLLVCRDGFKEVPSSGDRFTCETSSHSGRIVVGFICVIILTVIIALLVFFLKRKLRPFKTKKVIKSPLNMRLDVNQERSQEVVYENTMDTVTSKTRIKVEDLKEHIKNVVDADSDGFVKEFEGIPKIIGSSTSYGQQVELKPKNRFHNIFPYNKTRVVLSNTGEPLSDYINASHVKGYDKIFPIIAAQGPMDQTLDDFWRMIVEQDVNVIVMLTQLVENDKNKCILYWPEENDLEVGKFKITSSSTTTGEIFMKRILNVSVEDSSKERQVTHWQYLGWPDHGVPIDADAFLRFRQLVRASLKTNGKMLVHCSAGVGRTGCFIAIDSLLMEAEEQGSVDVVACVTKLREERPNMVQTAIQYDFIYIALKTSFEVMNTYIPISVYHKRYLRLCEKNSRGKSKIEEEYDTLTRQFGKIDTKSSKGSKNETGQWMCYSIKGPSKFIAAGFPNNSSESFWNMCLQHIPVVIAIDFIKEPKLPFLPAKNKPFHYKDFTVKNINSTQNGVISLESYLINKNEGKEEHFYENNDILKLSATRQLTIVRAQSGHNNHLNRELFTAIRNQMTLLSANCKDGNNLAAQLVISRKNATLAYFYIACCHLYDQLMTKEDVSVYKTVLDLHETSDGLALTSAQYEKLYEIIDKEVISKRAFQIV